VNHKQHRNAVALWVAALFICMALAMSLHGKGYLTQRDWDHIRSNWQDYAWAENRVGLPNGTLACIHFREAGLKRTSNIGGPFMLDLGPLDNPKEFARRIRAHEAKIAKKYGYRSGARVSADFRFAALVAADELKSKARKTVAPNDRLADALWGYNGRASWYQTFKDSPYVWNDPKRGIHLVKKYRKPDGEMVEFVDSRPGAMVIFQEIRRARGES
jgi:hypothetical protein